MGSGKFNTFCTKWGQDYHVIKASHLWFRCTWFEPHYGHFWLFVFLGHKNWYTRFAHLDNVTKSYWIEIFQIQWLILYFFLCKSENDKARHPKVLEQKALIYFFFFRKEETRFGYRVWDEIFDYMHSCYQFRWKESSWSKADHILMFKGTYKNKLEAHRSAAYLFRNVFLMVVLRSVHTNLSFVHHTHVVW